MANTPTHIEWFRHTGPYLRNHRGKTFVVYLGSGSLENELFGNLTHDLALLHLLGIRLILVPSTRGAIETELETRGIESRIYNGLRVTDQQVLEVVRDVTAGQRLLLERRLSMGLPDSPMRGTQLRIFSGNFVTARPVGVVDGVDFHFTGAVRKLDADAINAALDAQGIVILSPLGFSPTGEVFNLSSDDLAAAASIAIGADKLIIMDDHDGLFDEAGNLLRQTTVAKAKTLNCADDLQRGHRDVACRACERGVARAHLINFLRDGALIDELFTHDGTGTLISREEFERDRPATVDDIAGVLELVRPLEERGVLVRRSRERLEQEIRNFRVLERDGRVIACAALYPFLDDAMAEVACVATHPDYQGGGRGEYLLSLLESEAKQSGVRHLFALTTQSSHWFQEQGFVEQPLSALPDARQKLYNLQRNSKVLMRTIKR